MSHGLAELSHEDPRWRRFARGHASSPLQQPEWLDALVRAYRLNARVAVLTRPDGELAAGLPMIRGKLPWRRGWTSLPFTDVFEPIASGEHERDQLLTAAAPLPDGPILLRGEARVPGWTSRQLGTVHVVDVSAGAEGVLAAASSRTRRQVQLALDRGLYARRITSPNEFLGPVFQLMLENRRRLGTPTQPRSYWTQLWLLHDSGRAVTLGVYLRGQLVAAEISLIGGEHAVGKHACSNASTLNLRPNYLLYAVTFDELSSRGVRTMSLGITDLRNKSLREFKSHWAQEERPAYYSATDPRLLPERTEMGPRLAGAIRHAPPVVGRAIGALGYPLMA